MPAGPCQPAFFVLGNRSTTPNEHRRALRTSSRLAVALDFDWQGVLIIFGRWLPLLLLERIGGLRESVLERNACTCRHSWISVDD
jgi:hypothetical protein